MFWHEQFTESGPNREIKSARTHNVDFYILCDKPIQKLYEY